MQAVSPGAHEGGSPLDAWAWLGGCLLGSLAFLPRQDQNNGTKPLGSPWTRPPAWGPWG